MNKRLLAAALVALLGSVVAAVPALAQTQTAAGNPPSATPATSATTTASVTTQRTRAKAVPAPGSRQCIRDTGSHIPPPKGQCLPVAGNSYSQQDIQQTGATTVGGALRMLDPSVTVGGH